MLPRILEKRDHKLVFGQDTASKIVMVWGSVISHIGKHVDRMRLLCTCETCDPSLLHLICPLPCHFKYRYRHLLGQNPSNLHHLKICPNTVFLKMLSCYNSAEKFTSFKLIDVYVQGLYYLPKHITQRSTPPPLGYASVYCTRN